MVAAAEFNAGVWGCMKAVEYEATVCWRQHLEAVVLELLYPGDMMLCRIHSGFLVLESSRSF